MSSFDISDGLYAASLTIAYGILLAPLFFCNWRDPVEREQGLLAIGCAIAGALLLARLQDILKAVVSHRYGVLSADLVIGLLLILAALFWQLITRRLLVWMGQAIGHVLRFPFELLRPTGSSARMPLSVNLLLLIRGAVVAICGAGVLYLWFAVPSVLVGIGRSLDSERATVEAVADRRETATQNHIERLAMLAYSEYGVLRNGVRERLRQPECKDPCRRQMQNLQSSLANTLAHYQIRAASPAAFRTALADQSVAAAFQSDIRRIGTRTGIHWPQGANIAELKIPDIREPDWLALQEQTDRLVMEKLIRAVTAPGLQQLAPALRDPVLLIVFLVELCMLATLLFANVRESRT